MRAVISSEPIPIKLWLEDIEESAMEQVNNLAKLPFVFKHIAIMPDAHAGYGMPIGGVLATKGVVIPNAVGVDIGCGMCAMETSLEEISTDQIKKIMGIIRATIPTGFNHHKEAQDWHGFDDPPDIPIIQKNLESARKQLGTLGGGNHFIEIQKGSNGAIWVMIHSGSRNFGYQIAKVYNKKAQELCKRWYSNIPDFKGEDGLAFLPSGSPEAKEYFTAMNYALDFAQANRMLMLSRVKEAFDGVAPCEFIEPINIHHNFAAWEHHFGQNVIVHRKGATRAYTGEMGIIPGSQGTASYIVRGLGNPESFMSCSHGAGRRMSRKKARETLDLEKEKAVLDDKGIIHAIRNKKDLDEASSAYKDIDAVMKNQEDLVVIETKLEPLAVMKG